ncbi:hypothetical protein JCM10207_005651 [Rhodosporidiobolus poonsookiae]
MPPDPPDSAPPASSLTDTPADDLQHFPSTLRTASPTRTPHTSAVSTEQPGPLELGRSAAPSPSPALTAHRDDPLATAPSELAGSSAVPQDATASPAKGDALPAASPSTPTRSSSPSSAAAPSASPSSTSTGGASTAAADPTSSPLAAASVSVSASTSSPAASSSPVSSPSGSSSSSSASQGPLRRVKVYRLRDDAWIDLGTGTCAGVFLQASAPGDEGDGEGGGGGARHVSEEDEGAWLVVRRERGEGKEKRGKRGRKGKGREREREKDGQDSPTKGRGAEGDKEGGGEKMLVDEGGEAEKKKKKGEEGAGAGADEKARDAPESDSEEDEDDADAPGSDDEAAAGAPAPASEDDGDDIILRTRVQPYPLGYAPDDLLDDDDELTSLDDSGGTTVDVGGYQRQQDTLIVWTERGYSAQTGEEEEVEMALSFATASGCGEMWEFIKAARRFAAEQQALHSPSPSPSLSSERAFPLHATPSTFSSLTTLPEPSLGTLPSVEAALRAIGRTAVGRERATNMIVRTGFVEKLIRVHEEAEDLESLEDLHALCRVMQTILLLNDSALFDLVIQDNLILGVVGMLEYDPDFPTMRASYRAHLSSPTAFIPVTSTPLPPSLLSKIHATHRLHYLKDVVLARILEDSTFSLLNSHIYFNEVDLVNEVTGDRELVREVFRALEDANDGVGTGAGGGGTARGRDPQVGPQGKAKERERGLGPKRTLGPELPDDLVAARAKRPRLNLDEPPASGSEDVDLVPDSAPSSSAAPASPSRPSSADSGDGDEAKLHATLFLQQLAQMAKNLQLPLRSAFWKTMCDRGLLSAVEGALRASERLAREGEGEGDEKKRDDAKSMRSAALALWMGVVDLDAMDVRAYCLRQGKEVEAALEEAEGAEEGEKEGDAKAPAEGRRTMLGLLIDMFIREEDLGVKTQLAEALRVLVDVAGEGGPLEAPPRMRQEDPEAEKFLQYFYDHCILSLVQPLMDLPERKDTDPPLDLPPAKTALLSHICDLLCFFVSHHTFRSKYLVLSNPALAKAVARLLRPRPRLTRHTHLRLAALRFIRAIVARTDDFYNRFLIKHDLVRPVLETADMEKEKDNLLGSACLEFFEYLRTTNAKALLNHVMDRSGDQVRALARGNALCPPLRTFEQLIARWEMNNEPPPVPVVVVSAAPDGPGLTSSSGEGATSASMQRQRSIPGAGAGWSPRKEMEEEGYFNTSDDDDDDAAAELPPVPGAGAAAALALNLAGASFGSSRRKREPTSNPSLLGRGEGEAGEAKRAKLEADAAADAAGVPRSRTWPEGRRGGLVDYLGEGDSDDEDAAAAANKPAAEEEDPATAGGFIRERRGAVDAAAAAATAGPSASTGAMDVDEDSPSAASTTKENGAAAAPPPPPLLSLGELKRKKDEDEDGEMGLLASAAKKKAPSPSSPTSAGAGGKAPVPAKGEAKQGGFKIAFGLKSKFLGGGGGKDK